MKSTRYVVVGTSAFVDTTVAVGAPSLPAARAARGYMTALGYSTEICPLLTISDLELLVNDEGGEA